MIEVKSLQFNTWHVTYTKDVMAIGCQQYTLEQWFNFSDEQISRMDVNALDWWNKYKHIIKELTHG